MELVDFVYQSMFFNWYLLLLKLIIVIVKAKKNKQI